LDWCMRFWEGGWKILFVPDAVVVHYQGACSKHRPIRVEWHKHCGMVRFHNKFFRKRYPAWVTGAVWVGTWLHFALVSGYYGLRHGLRWLQSKQVVLYR
jgi:GT2 family glycosyltransferase